MMYGVIRIRGKVGVRQKLEDTLGMLNLKNKFNCTILPETEDYRGMLKKVERFVTWGKINKDTAIKILDKNGVENPEEIAEGLEEGKSLSKMNVRRSFPLSPPSGGFKGSTKNMYPKGEAGNREDGVEKLFEKMM